MVEAKAKQSARRGFTFALSALLIALTLISMAFFSSQWRKSQQISYNEVLPSDAVKLKDKIAGDMRSLTGASADVRRTGTSEAAVKVSFSLPLKKEGAEIADMSKYSQSLASSLRGSGVEAAISANVSGNSPTVITLPDSGSFALQNSIGGDVASYSHPSGWQPVAMNASFYCNKRVASISSIALAGTGGSAVSYGVVFREQDGRTYTQTATGTTQGNATLTVNFDDGTRIAYLIRLSPSSQNTTTINYTKSPGAYLILPFDANASLSAGGLQDYSDFQNNFTLGGGSAASAPASAMSEDCKTGSCYVFNGSNKYLNGTLPNATQAAAVQGTHNFGFETTYNVSG
ncbi:MAG: hypothetical protein WCT52_05810 [Candidatus Micrarchaeia archaeon]